MHGYVATKKSLYKMGLIESPRCSLCNLGHQSIKHLLIDCFEVKNFWFRFKDFLQEKYGKIYDINDKVIIFGNIKNIDNKQAVNEYLMAGKYYIYKTSKDFKKLSFPDFLGKIDYFIKS